MILRLISACVALLGLFLYVMAALVSPANATWKQEYANAPQAVQDWYKNAELTPAAKTRFNFQKCCAQSETVKTKFKIDKSTGADEWFWLDPSDNSWKQVPPDIIHWDQSGPNGEAVLFAIGRTPTCFFPPQGGG